MSGYITVKAEATASITEKRSVFIGYVAPVDNEADAISFVKKIRAKHSDARHNVFAYTIRHDNTTRFSDDGEPHGTAGMPVLDVLRKENIIDAVIVVTRYFGGILLGTGGLVRAYTAAAKAALDEAGTVFVAKRTKILVETTYEDSNRVENAIAKACGAVSSREFCECVRIEFTIEEKDAENVLSLINDASRGKARCEVS